MFYIDPTKKWRKIPFMTKIELVAIDLDGTLINSSGHVSAANKDAITKIQEQGIKVILATGKTRFSAEHIIDELGLSLPGVFIQGLMICDGDGSILRETRLDPQAADSILHYLDQNQLPYIANTRHGLFVPQADPYYDNINSKYDEPEPQVIGPMSGRAAEIGINKILVGDKTGMQKRRQDLQTRFSERVTILQAVPEYLEILPSNVSKGEGLQWLLNYMKIDPQSVLAIGDGENDIEMLRLCGIGVAMGSAGPQVCEAADVVVGDNDQNGVAEALERFIK